MFIRGERVITLCLGMPNDNVSLIHSFLSLLTYFNSFLNNLMHIIMFFINFFYSSCHFTHMLI